MNIDNKIIRANAMFTEGHFAEALRIYDEGMKAGPSSTTPTACNTATASTPTLPGPLSFTPTSATRRRGMPPTMRGLCWSRGVG